MKATLQILFLLVFLGSGVSTSYSQAIVPENAEAIEMEKRWQAIWPEIFADDSQKHIGASIRFTTGPFTNIKAGTIVVIKTKDGSTIRVSNVSKSARSDIATPHEPPTFVTIEGQITAIDATKRTVAIKATKVDVRW